MQLKRSIARRCMMQVEKPLPPRPNPASVSDHKADRYGLGSRTVASFFETDITSSGCLWHTLRLFY